MSEDEHKVVEFVDLAKVSAEARAVSEEEAASLEAVNQRVAAGESLYDILDFLFDSTRRFCPCDRISLAFLEENGQRVVSHHPRATYEPILLGEDYAEDLRGSSLAAVLKTGRARMIGDLEQYLHRKPRSRSTALLVKEGVRSSMTCPLSVEGRLVGFLFRSSRKPFAYGHHQVALHQTVAERLSQAVEKAYRIEQLIEANRAYSEVLGFVAHEMKAPLSSMIMTGNVLLGDYLGPLQPEQREKIGVIVRKAQDLTDLIAEYLNLARVEGGKVDLKTRLVDLKEEVVKDTVGMVRVAAEAKGMRIVEDLPEGPVEVECDPSLLRIVVGNLLSNAVKYGAEGGEVRLSATFTDGRLRVTVRNDGPGFEDADQTRLFRRFSRLQKPELLEQPGTGLGLYISWQIVQLHEGRIDAESEPGKWAEFAFDIPRRRGANDDDAP